VRGWELCRETVCCVRINNMFGRKRRADQLIARIMFAILETRIDKINERLDDLEDSV